MSSILFVGNYVGLTAGTRGISEDLAQRLAHAGHAVALTSRRRNRMFRLLDMLRTAWNHRHCFDIALIDVYSGPAFRYAEAVSWLLRRLHKPYLLTLHGGSLPDFASRAPRRVVRLLTGARAVTAPCDYLTGGMAPYCPSIQLIPNPIDVPSYPARCRTHCEPRLVWLRAMHRIYRPEIAVEAVALLRPEFPSLTLTLVGPDKGDGTAGRVRRRIRELGLGGCVQAVGAVPKSEVPAYLSAADIFLNTTSVDNAPVSVLEAMACGLAIVSTNVGGIPYLLRDGYEALLVPPDDAPALAAAIRCLLTDPALAASLSAAAIRRARQYDWSHVVPLWEKTLRDALQPC